MVPLFSFLPINLPLLLREHGTAYERNVLGETF